jgi:hypothetical protein
MNGNRERATQIRFDWRRPSSDSERGGSKLTEAAEAPPPAVDVDAVEEVEEEATVRKT